MATAEEWAWLAGIFEGEGCITFTGRNSACLSVNMTDEDIVRRCESIAGVGSIYLDERALGRKPLWQWRVAQVKDVLWMLDHLEPFLGRRRTVRAVETRARLAGCRLPGRCKRGHPMKGANLYVSPGGQRQCRTCARERDEARRARLAA